MKLDNIFWYLIVGTRGGPTRLQILATLSQRPYNANQLSSILVLDYKTVRRHLDLLLENGIIVISKEKRYGELYFLTDFAKTNLKEFEPIIKKMNLG